MNLEGAAVIIVTISFLHAAYFIYIGHLLIQSVIFGQLNIKGHPRDSEGVGKVNISDLSFFF